MISAAKDTKNSQWQKVFVTFVLFVAKATCKQKGQSK